jgi:hypothetical protein
VCSPESLTQFDVEADRFGNSKSNVQLHRWLAALEFADDSPIDTHHVRNIALAETETPASIANLLAEAYGSGMRHGTDR